MKIMIVKIALLFFLSSCSSFFYQPTSVLYSDPSDSLVQYENHYFKSLDGTQLHSWYLQARPLDQAPKGTVVFFHGNAQNLSSHWSSLGWLTEKGYSVFIFDYRGYGLSQKVSPNQAGVYRDGLAALQYGLSLHEKKKAKKFIVYGQSLGAAIMARSVIDFKETSKIDLIVLDSTFDNYQKVAKSTVKRAGVLAIFSPLAGGVVSNEYTPDRYYDQLKMPALVIHGKEDQVIPFEFGERIFKNLKMEKKWFWPIEDGKHIDAYFRHKLIYREKFYQLLESEI